MSPRPRGQALVLLALTLLVLGVMLAMTLAIGQRAKERVELQTITDVAAFDTAQATARAFNSFAVLNRAAVGHWVALSGTEALIAWSGPSGDPSLAEAQQQVRDMHDSIDRIEILEEKIFVDLMFEVVEDGRYQRAAAAMADGEPDPGRGRQYKPPRFDGHLQGGQAGCKEVCHAVHDTDLDEADRDDLDLAEIAEAVQGSRGYAFTVIGTPTEAVHTYIRDDAAPWLLLARIDDDAYYDTDWVLPDWYKSDVPGTYSIEVSRWQSISAVSYPMPPTGPWGAPALGGGANAVISTADDDPNDHFGAWTAPNVVPFSPGASLGRRGQYYANDWGDDKTARTDHIIPKHPGVFRGGFGFVDGVRYRQGKYGPSLASPQKIGWDDLYGQPKLAIMMWRYSDPDAPKYPWELLFRLRFSPSSAGSEVNLRRSRRMEMGNDSFLFHAMGGLASGLAYYHRPGHLAEPANMLNPFWRATLVPTDIDKNGESMMEALNHIPQVGMPEHEEHWNAGWRPGDVGFLAKGGMPTPFWMAEFPELMILEYRLINQGGYSAVP